MEKCFFSFSEKQMIDTNYQNCQLCPRSCGVDRRKTQGFCGEGASVRIASFTAHFGEEPCISGTKGSGAIFFSGCSCQCFFCQNHQISHLGLGEFYSLEDFYLACRHLIDQKVHNLNFVTPDHFEPHIRQVAFRLRQEGETLPFIWNGSGYHRSENIPKWADYINIFLPDFKFLDPDLAQRCMGDRHYPDIALRALEKMVELKGFLFPWSDTPDLLAREGVLVRHLVLPGFAEHSIRVLQKLKAEFGKYLPVSLMSQYCPVEACKGCGTFERMVSPEEYEAVCEVAEELGFESLFIQENNGDVDFLPDFSCQEMPFIGNRKQQELHHNEKK